MEINPCLSIYRDESDNFSGAIEDQVKQPIRSTRDIAHAADILQENFLFSHLSIHDYHPSEMLAGECGNEEVPSPAGKLSAGVKINPANRG